ncbi:MAG: glycosyltransferase family 4 protein [Deltaproteobacteria bacterium]|nr:glycosyltransferase family 4 protein [Deltaproteobacteria bacterium]
MKIVAFFNSFILSKSHFGGADTRFREIVRRLQKRHSITCVGPASGKEFLVQSDPDIRYITTPSISDQYSHLAAVVIDRILRSAFGILYFRSSSYDIFISCSDSFPDVIPPFWLKRHSVRWVQPIFHITPSWRVRQGILIWNILKYLAQRFSFALIKKRADVIIVLNQSTKQDLVKLGFTRGRIVVSSCAINIPYIKKISAATNGFDGIFMGRVNYSKGVLDLMPIWREVCDIIPQARLRLIGFAPLNIKKVLMAEIERYDLLENIQLMGFVDYELMIAMMKASRVFLFPSHEEGWGISIAEAMACGLPVVSWDLPVYRHVFEDCTSQVTENNIEEFANQVILLLQDETKRQTIGARGAKFVEKYSWDKVARFEEEIITGRRNTFRSRP